MRQIRKILAIRSAATIAAVVLLAGCDDADTQRQDGTAARGDALADSVPTADTTPNSQSAPTAELRVALEALVGGRSDQVVGEGGSSWFSAETADVLRSVRVDSTGHATVDFHDLRPLIPNASSSAGSAALLAELNATVFQFPGIRSVEYRMDGSCDLFWEWLQYGCRTVTRESAQDWRRSALQLVQRGVRFRTTRRSRRVGGFEVLPAT